MIIGIDGRMFGIRHAGIGRYVENLISNLLEIDKENFYKLFVREVDNITVKKLIQNAKNKNVEIIILDAPHYSFKEQILFPLILNKHKVDLMHFPHFNAPILYRGKFVLTIHDLLWHDKKGLNVTTLNPLVYFIKYIGFRIIFLNAVYRAQKILVPSYWVKNKLIKRYPKTENKIIVINEGVEQSLWKKNSEQNIINPLMNKYGIRRPFYLYVGSAYPHKNLKILLEAIKLINESQLVIICARNYFWNKLKKTVKEYNLENRVILPGFITDEALSLFYQNAEGFIFPSLSEGFGLPGLEAMSCGCPVISSNEGALPEVYKDAALYFNPLNKDELIKCMNILRDENVRSKLIAKEKKLIKNYTWVKTAEQTLEIYESCTGI